MVCDGICWNCLFFVILWAFFFKSIWCACGVGAFFWPLCSLVRVVLVFGFFFEVGYPFLVI